MAPTCINVESYLVPTLHNPMRKPMAAIKAIIPTKAITPINPKRVPAMALDWEVLGVLDERGINIPTNK